MFRLNSMLTNEASVSHSSEIYRFSDFVFRIYYETVKIYS